MCLAVRLKGGDLIYLSTSDSPMARIHDVRDLRATAARALENGATVARRSTVKWNVSGSCSNSVNITLTGRPGRRASAPTWRYPAGKHPPSDRRFWATYSPERKHQVVSETSNNPLWLDIEARCRRCPQCLAARARLWRERMEYETRLASRTWLGTLTLSAQAHHLMMCRASTRLRRSAVCWDRLTETEQLIERHSEISKEITLWLKRVRSQSEADIRLICVMERHKTGLPHYHLLIHEGAAPVVKRVLQSQWKLGFTNFKLIEAEATAHAKACRYVAKYLMKSAEARVRASVRYGREEPSLGSDSVIPRPPKIPDLAARPNQFIGPVHAEVSINGSCEAKPPACASRLSGAGEAPTPTGTDPEA